MDEHDGACSDSHQYEGGPSRRARSQRFSRAKTGCFTCRARRKKCDETRDAATGSCERCLKSGIECLGFPKLRGAPLAAHSKKLKAAAAEGPRRPPVDESVQDARADDLASIGMQADTSSFYNHRSMSVTSAQQLERNPFAGANASPVDNVHTLDELSLSDIMRLETPSPLMHASSQYPNDHHTSLFDPAADNGLAMQKSSRFRQQEPASPDGSLGLSDSFFSLAAVAAAASRNGGTGSGFGGLGSGIGSPIPGLTLNDWMPDMFERGSTPRLLAFPNVREEERALKSLAAFYGQFCWSWWVPRRAGRTGRRSLQHVVHAIERRLRRSEIVCTTVAAVAACYGFGNHITLNNDMSVESFRQSWERIYEVVCDTKTSSLCAYLDWLGASNDAQIAREGSVQSTQTFGPENHPSASSNMGMQSPSATSSRAAQEEWELSIPRNGDSGSSSGSKTTSQSQADRLFSFASKVLARVALAAKQDQDISTDMSAPLEYAALVHVDIYLQAAMDLALFAYASRPANVFHRELNAAGSLLESLLGRGQSVRLSEIDGVETAGFRTFVWSDITNAVVSARSTRLHYLFDDADRQHPRAGRSDGQGPDAKGKQQTERSDRNHDPSIASQVVDQTQGQEQARNSSDARHRSLTKRRSSTRHSHRKGVNISFGCPDDILVIFAHISNLHFQLRHARATGAIKGNGPESLPAWALQTAYDLARRIERSEQDAEQDYEEERYGQSTREGSIQPGGGEDVAQQTMGDSHMHREQQRSHHLEEGKLMLASMWRHAAVIFLHTTAYRLGPLGKVNQERMREIIRLWTANDLQADIISNGNPALPLLFAAFVAHQPDERQICRDALRLIGQHEVSRAGYRAFIERLWRKTDEAGFAMLWHDLVDDNSEESSIAIM